MDKVKQRKKRASHGYPLPQVAALAYRWSEAGRLEMLVLSSRETHRPVIPKGWPIKGRKDWKSAEIEARQEAGLVGQITRKSAGHYRYWKRIDRQFVLVQVSVYPLEVRRQLDDWPERNERVLMWLPPEDAALLVDETDLGALILDVAGDLRRRHDHATGLPERTGEPAATTT
ncbi:8-oxo-dGTP pyrophosphatase MutT (NUDIX family) [Ancylobacter sp. 3268]|uniref:NUDIX hydrolase n=1 Tax=Ancylobacter sp. 3268 TaxID=2817752 RepID=UPI00285F04E7|nr:NUDIX hydrolase [Ancylobacter sp. 3268]MDR6951584.1 8-oxo-dGTP pyrophosphatase MutT (NUDIX family) [Ancylobacter sp. 3268]